MAFTLADQSGWFFVVLSRAEHGRVLEIISYVR